MVSKSESNVCTRCTKTGVDIRGVGVYITNMTYQIEIASDLFEVVHPEDGSIMDGEAFYLQAINEDGRRFIHHQRFVSEWRSQRAATIASVERYLEKVQTAQLKGWKGPENNENWTETTPAYGSWAYQCNWRKYAAQSDLAEGNFEPGGVSEFELRSRAD